MRRAPPKISEGQKRTLAAISRVQARAQIADRKAKVLLQSFDKGLADAAAQLAHLNAEAKRFFMWLARIAVLPVSLAAMVVGVEAATEIWHYASSSWVPKGAPLSLVRIAILSVETAALGWLANRLLNATGWFSSK